MEKTNILNYYGYLTDEDRKQIFEHSCEHFTFYTNLDLSIPIKIIPFGNIDEFSIDEYSRDLASFFTYWTYFVLKDLNGFSGFHNVKFDLVGFKLKQD